MERRLHFVSGLPRSGSTLLASILRQNPRFHAGISSPLASMLITLQQVMSAKSEYHPLISDRKRRAVLVGLAEQFYADADQIHVVFDTNRAWCSKIGSIAELFPKSRVICCVRPLAWIFDSFERIIQANPLEPSRIFGYDAGGNVYTRIDALNNPLTGTVGSALSGLREAFYGAYSQKLILVTYDSLVKRTARTIEALYDALGETSFKHDFADVRFDADEFDTRLGTPGLHRVGQRIQWVERKTVLPPDLFERFDNSAFWAAPDRNPNRVPVL